MLSLHVKWLLSCIAQSEMQAARWLGRMEQPQVALLPILSLQHQRESWQNHIRTAIHLAVV